MELPDGTVLGRVETYMAMMERKTPGKRYVNARWHSMRWCATPANSYNTIRYADETPGRAAERLLREYRRAGLTRNERSEQ